MEELTQQFVHLTTETSLLGINIAESSTFFQTYTHLLNLQNYVVVDSPVYYLRIGESLITTLEAVLQRLFAVSGIQVTKVEALEFYNEFYNDDNGEDDDDDGEDYDDDGEDYDDHLGYNEDFDY